MRDTEREGDKEINFLAFTTRLRERKRETERQTDRQTDRQSERQRQTDRGRDRDREKDRDRQTDRDRERDRDKHREKHRQTGSQNSTNLLIHYGLQKQLHALQSDVIGTGHDGQVGGDAQLRVLILVLQDEHHRVAL